MVTNPVVLETIVVERRFLGPPNSANGGYICGRIARHIDGAAEVTLRRPPPLETELALQRAASGSLTLRHGEAEIASARPVSAPAVTLFAPSLEAAARAAARTFPAERHPLPTCFVCGPVRKPGDGLRLHVGPVAADDPEWNGELAAPWTPDDSLADDDGLCRAEFLWAALDCPTAYASSSAAGMRTILLGRQSVSVVARPRVGQPCIVVTKASGRDGRKFYADAMLCTAEGERLAVCRAVWIEVSPEVQRGQA